jgi:hypothetical protein
MLRGKRAKLQTCSGGNETEGKLPIHCSIYTQEDNKGLRQEDTNIVESHFHNQKGSSGALPLHNHNTPTLHKQSQSVWSETQVHKTLRTMKGALERCSDTAQATITPLASCLVCQQVLAPAHHVL